MIKYAVVLASCLALPAQAEEVTLKCTGTVVHFRDGGPVSIDQTLG
jgi:hypothetical protein